MRTAFFAAGFAIAAGAASAATIDIDLNDFFADPTVTVSSDGTSAFFTEDLLSSSVLLANEPVFGDPGIFVADAGTSLTFDYDFVEASGEDNSFFAALFDDAGTALGSAFEFDLAETGSGSVSFDLSAFVGQTLGLLFSFNAGFDDTELGSTLTVSNVALEIAPIPLPAGGALLLGGLFGFGLLARRRYA